MKDYAAAFAVELCCLYPENRIRTAPKDKDIAAVRVQMDREKRRRYTLDEVIAMVVAQRAAVYRQKP